MAVIMFKFTISLKLSSYTVYFGQKILMGRSSYTNCVMASKIVCLGKMNGCMTVLTSQLFHHLGAREGIFVSLPFLNDSVAECHMSFDDELSISFNHVLHANYNMLKDCKANNLAAFCTDTTH